VVDIDIFAGPSEVVIIADQTARPEFVAADMLAQAEHDPGSAILLTDQPALAEAVRGEIEKQLATLSRSEEAARSLNQYGAIVVVRELMEALVLANELAAEHLQIETANPMQVADRIDAAGAIFLGHHTPEAVGDYVAGPSHVLPTGGTARFWSGLSARSFRRYTSMIEYTRSALAHDAAAIERLALAEGLDAHARSVTLRTAAGSK
jgi:histidinol dehydrogenase